MSNICCVDSSLSVEELKTSFLFGIPLKNGSTGEPMSDDVLKNFIDVSYEYLETLYDIQVRPKLIENEFQDFFMDQAYRPYFMVHTNKIPVLWDPSDRERYPIVIKAFFGAGVDPMVFPRDWFRVNPKAGSIHIYPTTASMGSFLLQFQSNQVSLVTSQM